jgi:Ca2+-binding RTX toxin-like protein
VGSGTVNAIIGGGSDQTWGLADQISGGTAGSTLNLTAVVGNTDVSTTGRATSGIENFNITFADSDNNAGKKLIVDTSTLTGAKNFTIVSASASSGDEVEFTGLTKAQTLTIKSADSDLNVTAGYKSGELSGTSDEVTVAFNGAKLGTLKINDSTTAAAETVILNAAGGASTVKKLDIVSNKLKTLKVTGAGDLTVTEKIALSEFDSSATKNTIDASGASGKVTLRTDLTSKLDAKGGSGTSDRLILDVASSVTTGAAISGFERVDLQASNSATVKATLISGATALNVLADTNNISGNTLTLNDVAAGTGINIVGTGKNQAQWANAVTYNQTGASSGTNDSVTIKISNGGTAVSSSNQLTVGTLTAPNIENVTVQVADFAKVAVGLAASAAKTITVEAGSAEVSFGGNTGGANTETINAGSSTGKISWGTIVAPGDLTFTGSEGVDILTIGGTTGTNKTQTYNLGKGNDVVTLVDQAGQAIVNGEDGDDSFTVNATTNIANLALHGGDGTDTLSISSNGSSIKFNKGFSGIEKIVLKTSSTTFTAEFQVASGYNEAVEVTDVSGVNVTLEFKTDAGGTIDLSNFTFLGWTSGTDIIKLTGTTGNETLKGTSQADIIEGGPGADIMTGGDGADVFLFANGDTGTPTATNFDTITDFVSGTDKIDLGTTNITALGSGSYGNITVGNNGLVTTSYTNLANFITDLAGTSITIAGAAMIAAIGSDSYLFISDGTAGLGSGDLLIKITGIAATTGLTISGGDITGIA